MPQYARLAQTYASTHCQGNPGIMDSKRRRITPNEMDLCRMAGDPRWQLDVTEDTQSLVYVGPEPMEDEIEDLYVPQPTGPVQGPQTLQQHLLERVMALTTNDSGGAREPEAKEPEANTNDDPVCQ